MSAPVTLWFNEWRIDLFEVDNPQGGKLFIAVNVLVGFAEISETSFNQAKEKLTGRLRALEQKKSSEVPPKDLPF
jgi:hypothetical protein